jgi:hypothetical protein
MPRMIYPTCITQHLLHTSESHILHTLLPVGKHDAIL